MNNTPEYQLHRLVMEMDRAADKLLSRRLHISYKRFHFLAVLQDCGTISQHELAVAMGHSDPAISSMLLELAKEDCVTIIPDPKHGRKRLATITPKGDKLVAMGTQLLHARFSEDMAKADVDAGQYGELTGKLYRAVMIQEEEKSHDK